MGKEKWYVVLKGRIPGIYTSWEEASAQVSGYPSPLFRSFESKTIAERVFQSGHLPAQTVSKEKKSGFPPAAIPRKPSGSYVVVDAACSGVPGPTEYQGFLMPEKKLLFSVHIGQATNNIGEFLGIIHALAYLKQSGSELPVYSDSKTALSWMKKKQIKSNLDRNKHTENAWKLVDRALIWLNNNPVHNRLHLWETSFWGENPADFGRK